ncbi:polysaccharide biosynthesis protein [Lysinibacillus endophyticus]|uniref:polysaccharide biosynthesis protein n=1 Tax=Ureibacillus endophyticus TaxID=1978490 RepID=UPI00209D657A|nr:nucleoside-diphosphate sugar epimerase/dehydratase [Lysinibacillus endophyticus]MCP1144128.1 polysaccharide biosynthesis protein [Lysinibacillus endophyticus]
MILCAIFISYWLVNPISIPDSIIIISFLILLIVHHIMAHFFQLYNRIWSVASVKELLVIGLSVSICVSAASIIQLFIQQIIYVKVMIITWLLQVVLIGGSRFLLRVFYDYRKFKNTQIDLKRVLIVGAGEAGTLLIRSLKRNPIPEYYVAGIVDDNPNKQNLSLMGVKVCGFTKDIPEIVKELQIDMIILAIPSLGKKDMKTIYNYCAKTKAKIKTMPKIEEIMLGKVKVNDVREVKIEHLLGREEIQLDLEVLSNKLLDKVILVTGAGGSIGSEICRQVAQFSPRQILLLGHGENSIYNIHFEMIENPCNKNIEVIPIIADIQDRERIFEVVQKYRPDVIYHAAAHKHVPLMEENPQEAIKNNVFGTKNVADAAHLFNVSNFVMISTDKAVKPTSVMGSTKRIAEMIIQNLAIKSSTNFTAVRFGNVLDSRGSVVPRFKSQILAGGPVTVTHPEMTRYFMTIPEASRLVIQAGALAHGGEVFVLDMGEPIRIVDLAENLIKLCGYSVESIGIKYTGIRPGEKLHEELLNEEEIQEMHIYPKIHIGKATPIEEKQLLYYLDELNCQDFHQLKSKVIEIANKQYSNKSTHIVNP